jgi:hypothetical protein
MQSLNNIQYQGVTFVVRRKVSQFRWMFDHQLPSRLNINSAGTNNQYAPTAGTLVAVIVMQHACNADAPPAFICSESAPPERPRRRRRRQQEWHLRPIMQSDAPVCIIVHIHTVGSRFIHKRQGRRAESADTPSIDLLNLPTGCACHP